MRFLVTAGNTRERIDLVRDWGNIFTGNTGLAIAMALAPIGQVDLLTSNRVHLAQVKEHPAIRGLGFTEHAELKGALAALMSAQAYDAVFMTAAVADYKPAGVFRVVERRGTEGGRQTWVVENVQAGKVKSTHPAIAVLGQPTEKLVDLFRTQWNHRGLLVKFKLEVGITKDALLEIGQASRMASGADYLVANTLEMVTGPQAGAYLIWQGGHEFVLREELAGRLARLVRR